METHAHRALRSMLARKYRIQNKKDVWRTIRYGRSFGREPFFAKILTNGKSFSRFAVVVGSEIDKRSSKRNRLKRVIRAGLSEILPKVRPGFDVVIRLKAKLPKTTSAEAKKMLEELFMRAGLLMGS